MPIVQEKYSVHRLSAIAWS